MESIINFILNNDTIIMVALLITIILLSIIIVVTDHINKNKNIDAKEEVNSEVIDNSSSVYNEDLNQYDKIIQEDNKISEIKYVEDDEELEKTKAQMELKNLKDELIKAEQKEKEKEKQEEIIPQKEVEILTLTEEKLDRFESLQEENAIISLEEFNKISDKKYEENEITQYKDEGNEPISIQELEELYKTKELNVISDEAVLETKEELNKFKTSPVISPVYGIEQDENMDTLALENTANLDKLSEEIKKTNEFLNALKELKKNLQ